MITRMLTKRTNFKICAILSFLILALFFWEFAFADLPQQIFFQAKLRTAVGTTVSGSHTAVFRLYSASTGGSSLWSETQTVTADASGVISCYLGSTTAPPSTIDFNSTYYLSIEVDSDGEMSPRIKIVPALASLNSDRFDGLNSTQFLRSDTADTMEAPLSITSYVTQSYTGTAADAVNINFNSASGTYDALDITYGSAGGTGTALKVTQSGTGDILQLYDGSTGVLAVKDGGNVGIGTSSPTQGKLTVTGGDTAILAQGDLRLYDTNSSNYSGFQANGTTTADSVYTLPPTYPGTAGFVLVSDTSGNLSWSNAGTVIPDDSLDFTEFEDTLDLDANLILNQSAYTWIQNFTGVTTTGLTYNADSLTSGSALALASTATAFTDSLVDVALSGSNAANTGSLLTLTNSGTANTNTAFYIKHYATGTGNLAMRVDDESSDTTPFVIDGAGNVGIGTTSPTTLLQLGATGKTGILSLADSVLGNLITIQPVASTGAWTLTLPSSGGTSGYLLKTDGSGVTTWIAPGLVGTSWSSLTDPSTSLSLTMAANTSTFTYNAATSANNLFNLTDTISNTGTGYLFNLTTAASSTLKPLHVSAAGVEALTVLADGNVGIGTTLPDQKLSIAGTLGVLETGLTPSKYTIFQGGDQSVDITYTLPPDDGDNGEQLTTNGSGVLTWEAISTQTSALLSATHTDTLAGTVVRGDVIVGNSTPAWARLAKGNQYLSLTMGADDPGWGAIALNQSTAVSGILGSANGGTANGFTKFSGPTASEKTFTLPDASATILTSNATVTVAQGGTDRSSHTAYALIAGGTTTTAAQQSVANSATVGTILQSAGTSALPTYSTATYPATTTISQVLYSISANVIGGNANLIFDGTTLTTGGTTNNVALAATGTTYAGTARPKRSFYVDVGGMLPATTSGSGAVTLTETTNNKVNYLYSAFDGSTDEIACFTTPLPKSWDGGTITAIINYIPTGTTGGTGVVWTIAGVLIGDNVSPDTAYGTAVSVTDTIQTADYLHITPESGAMTIAGALSGEKYICWRITRDADVAGDTNTDAANLVGVLIKYTATTENDSA